MSEFKDDDEDFFGADGGSSDGGSAVNGIGLPPVIGAEMKGLSPLNGAPVPQKVPIAPGRGRPLLAIHATDCAVMTPPAEQP